MKTADLLQKHTEEWRAATHHSFLQGMYDGTLEPRIFATWLEQDYLFVRYAFVAISGVLKGAPRPAYQPLLQVLTTLETELSWLEEQLRAQNLSLSAALLPATSAYRDFLDSLVQLPFPAAFVSIWAIERAYWESWTHAAYGEPRHRAYVEHWTRPEFERMVNDVGTQVDTLLVGYGEYDRLTESLFQRVAHLQHDFWQMPYDAHHVPDASEPDPSQRELPSKEQRKSDEPA